MIAQSMEFLEEGSKMCETVQSDMKTEGGNIEQILNKAWDTFDKLKEAEHLSDGKDDEIYLRSLR